jgi:voltage-gated potassium channel
VSDTPRIAPPKAGPADSGLKPGYDLFIIVVTVVSIVNWIFLILPMNLGADTRGLLIFMEPILTAILLIDFGLRFHRAGSQRWEYMIRGGGWLDLLGSLPYGRVLRLFRLVRVLQAFHTYGWRNTVQWFIVNRAKGTLFMVFAFLLIVLEGGGLIVLYFEAGAKGANIETGGEALWWGVVTITTVGYGDYYPVTPGGEVVASIMIFAGVALIAIFTAWVASTFLAPAGSQAARDARATTDDSPADTSPAPAAVQPAAADPEGLIRDLRARLDQLEALVVPPDKGS